MKIIIDKKKMLEARAIVLDEQDVQKIEEIIEIIQDYALETGRVTEEGGTEGTLLSHILYLRSLYNAKALWEES